MGGNMILRIIVLSLALLIGISAVIPLTTNYTEAGVLKPKHSKKKYKKYKKYSQQWWRAYHNRVRQRKVLQARKRILRLRQMRLANAGKVSAHTNEQKVSGNAPNIQISNLFILVEGKIKKVFDGDTFGIENRDGKVYQIRMLGIDAPTRNQDFGDKSQKKLSDLILGKDATVIIRKMDSSERYVGTIYCGGKDINLLQLETGMALYFQQNGYEPLSSDHKIYEQAEQNARTKRKGLWGSEKSNIAIGVYKK